MIIQMYLHPTIYPFGGHQKGIINSYRWRAGIKVKVEVSGHRFPEFNMNRLLTLCVTTLTAIVGKKALEP